VKNHQLEKNQGRKFQKETVLEIWHCFTCYCVAPMAEAQVAVGDAVEVGGGIRISDCVMV